MGDGLRRRKAHHCAKAGCRVRRLTRRLARAGNSPCHESGKPEGAQSSGGSRATKGSRAQRGARRPAAAPGTKLSPERLIPGLGGAGWRWRPQPPRGPPTDRQPAGGRSPGAQAAGAGNRVGLNIVRPRHQPQPAPRSAGPVKQVSRAWSSARSGLRKVWGAPCFWGTWEASSRTSCRPTVQGGKGNGVPWPQRGRSSPPFIPSRSGKRMGESSLYGLSRHRRDNP